MADIRRYSDRAAYIIAAVRKRRKKIRADAVHYKGGRCQICGYNKCIQALEFHHLAPNKKDFGVSASGYTRSWAKVKEELDKCLMLCANCHREVHAEKLQPSQVIEIANEVNSGKPDPANAGWAIPNQARRKGGKV
jgi:5-methylcytosine-specific restriction endonuclease McrA